MLLCMHYLYESFTRLKNLQLKLEKELEILKKREVREAEGKSNRERTDLEVDQVRNSFNNAFLDLAMVVEESKELKDGDISPLIALQILMPVIKKRIENVNTVEELNEIIKMMTGPLESWIEQKRYDRLSYYDYSTNVRHFWRAGSCSYDTFAPDILQKVISAVKWRYDKVNVFDMYCRNSNISDQLCKDNRNVNVYGLDSGKNISKFSDNHYRRLIYGNLKGCVITNVCFDIVICSPVITINREIKAGAYVKTERELLFRAVDYLRPEGWLFFVIPYYRFYTEMCVHLLKNYHNFRVFTDNRFNGATYVICQKLAVPVSIENIDMSLYARFRNMPFNYATLDIAPDLDAIKLPDKTVEVKKFRGSELNEAELVELHNNSKCTATFWNDQTVEKLSETKARPLLPFNIGQLGLILTSGCLDGVVEEGNGFCHVVKGRVIKKVDTTESIDTHTHQVQIVNTTNNRVEISAFLPDGTYKCLA